MRQRFLVLLTVMLLGALTHIRAANKFYVTIDNIKYYGFGSEVTVTGMEDTSATTCDIPETIMYEGIAYPVTAIGSSAFAYCESLTEISLPNSVTRLGDFAFFRCTGLRSIRLSDSLTTISRWAFQSCESLTEISIPNSVTLIDMYAFAECSALTEIWISDSVKTIECNAFEECKSLSTIHMGNSVASIEFNAFDECDNISNVDISSLEGWLNITFNGYKSNPLYYGAQLSINGETVTHLTIPEGVTHLYDLCFIGCGSLESVIMPTSLEYVGDNLFSHCSGLQKIIFPTLQNFLKLHFSEYAVKWGYDHQAEIYIGAEPFSSFTTIDWPEELTVIPDHTFKQNNSLISINIPNTVTHIGYGAFKECSALTEIRIPDSVTSIGGSAFSQCRVLSDVTIGNSVQTIDWFAFYLCTALTEVRIPDSVTTIGDCAFTECKKLTDVTIGNSLTKIASDTFQGCYSLKNVSFGKSVNVIGMRAFDSCWKLSEVSLPESLTAIGSYAFARCTTLTEIRIPDSVTSIGSEAFAGCSSLERIIFGSSVQSIGRSILNECDNLYDIVITNLQGWCSVEFKAPEDNPIVHRNRFRIPERETPIKHLVIDLPGEDIADYVFFSASHLKTVRINAKKIGTKCFSENYNIEHICLNVEELDYGVFSDCWYLKAIYSMTKTPPVTASHLFYNIINPTLYVPIGSIGAYRASAYWSKFFDIRECDFSEIDSIFTADHEPMNAVRNIRDDASLFNLTVADGVISAEADPDISITIHNLQGTCIHSGKGNVSVAVIPGMYIVTAGGRSHKIAVR